MDQARTAVGKMVQNLEKHQQHLQREAKMVQLQIEAGNLAPRLDGNAATNPSLLSIVDVRLHAQNLPTHLQTGLH